MSDHPLHSSSSLTKNGFLGTNQLRSSFTLLAIGTSSKSAASGLARIPSLVSISDEKDSSFSEVSSATKSLVVNTDS